MRSGRLPKQRHTRLFRSPRTLPLITWKAACDDVAPVRLAALFPRENMVHVQLIDVLTFTTVRAPESISREDVSLRKLDALLYRGERPSKLHDCWNEVRSRGGLYYLVIFFLDINLLKVDKADCIHPVKNLMRHSPCVKKKRFRFHNTPTISFSYQLT